MKTADLLERDRERLMARLTKADNVEQTRSVFDDELGRIQLMYRESSEDPEMNEEAGYALSAIRAAIPLIDSTGEVKTYERAVSSSGGAFPILPAAADDLLFRFFPQRIVNLLFRFFPRQKMNLFSGSRSD